MKGAIKCPYHAWHTRSRALIGTPNVGKDEVDRDALGALAGVRRRRGRASSSSTSPDPGRSLDSLADQPERRSRSPASPRRPAHRPPDGGRGRGQLEDPVENYNECLHCPTVHPELSPSSPASATVGVRRAPPRGRHGDRRTAGQLHSHRTLELPVLPGLSATTRSSLYWACRLPNMFIDVTGTEPSRPSSPARRHTTVVAEYLSGPRRSPTPGSTLPRSSIHRARGPPGLRRVRAGASAGSARGPLRTACPAEGRAPAWLFKRRYLAARDNVSP